MLQVADGLIKTSQAEALILMTLYSPFMWARRIAGDERLSQHIHDNIALVQKGLETLTANVQTFVRACIDLGIDGFDASTQGGERHRFPDVRLFEVMVKPYDLIIMNEINERCRFNILHVCDYQGAYNDFSVLVSINKENNLNQIGFVTQEDLTSLGLQDMVAVYFPHSYAFSGNHFLVPKESIRPLNISGPTAMKFIVSGGISGFKEQ